MGRAQTVTTTQAKTGKFAPIRVRSLEAQLMSSSRQYARMRRARNPNVIFGDLKAAPSNEVDYLLRPLSATVVEIRSEDHAVVLSHPQPWDDTKPIVCHGLALPVIHAEEDCLWLQDIDAVSRADVVTQLHCTGTKEDLEAAFAQAWKARWDRHRDVPFERWNVILDFARRFLPRRQLRWPSITPEELDTLYGSRAARYAGQVWSQLLWAVEAFIEALDLLLDQKKTFVWSTSSQGRQCLRDQGFTVVDSCRMLGAHVQTTRKHTNATQMVRIHALQSMWPKLKLSASPYELKIRAIRVAAWPKGLHAIASTTVSLQTFSNLRSGAMKGLAADGSGCNAMVHLGMVERPATDLHFWTVLHTLRMVRDCGVPEVVHPALWELARGNQEYATNGISATLLTRLQLLGWHILSPTLVVDDFGSFSLLAICLAELQWRMEWAWVKVVAAHVSHRPGFAALECVDPVRTRQWLAKLILLGADVKINSPNADLWTLIAEDVIAGTQIQITKVLAHRDVSAANSPLEEWCFLHNQYADRAAARANECRDASFWPLLARHASACRSVDEWNTTIQQVLLLVSRKVLYQARPLDPVEPVPSESLPLPRWKPLPPLPSPPGGAIRWYGCAIVTKLMRWFWDAVECELGQMAWVSNAQLYMVFALTTGEAGPVHIHGWRDSADMPLHALRSIGFKERVRWFGKVLRETLRHAGVYVTSRYCRPASHMICMHASCFGAPWDPGLLDAVDRWMMRFEQ
ncbi:unnamed protein product [Cladocopium goreaui]|uniref:Uncharacterized protein n=1 Tax=Cladocopium goreaui TaxID=2562237 RepID=A0A9P1C075_9DINO|nr:unnamed protein product [Cladocopium goreaui]